MTGNDLAPFLAAMLGRCPACRQGPLFRNYLALHPRCPVCGADHSNADSADGPAVFVMFAVGAVAVPFAFVLQFGLGFPAWAVIVSACVLALALTLALLRPLKGLFVALAWRHRDGAPP